MSRVIAGMPVSVTGLRRLEDGLPPMRLEKLDVAEVGASTSLALRVLR